MTSPGHVRDERGSAILMALVVSVLLMGVLAVSISASSFSGVIATQYGNANQANLAAQAGLAAELTTMRNVTDYTSLPCGSFSGALTAPGAKSTYAGSVTYYPSGSNPSVLTCAGSTLGATTTPGTATITVTGASARGVTAKMQEDLAIAVTTTASPALDYAVFTSNTFNLTGAATITSTGAAPNVYSGGSPTCGSGTSVAGQITTYSSATFSGSCAFGGMVAAGGVTINAGGISNGSITSYGGSVTLTGSAKVNGNVTETNGGISMSGSAKITGNAAASGSIKLTGGSSIGGTQTPNDTSLAGQTMPPAVAFPTPSASDTTWIANGWSVIDIGSASCATYFKSNSSGAADPFQTAISTENTKTVYNATACDPNYSRSQTFSLAADTVLEVNTLTSGGSDTWSSTTSTHHDLSILASVGATCSTSNIDITVSNQDNFASSLTVFMYTPGVISYANNPSMTGQFLACGGFTGSNSFSMAFDPQASAEIPGLSTAGPPTVSVTDKFIR